MPVFLHVITIVNMVFKKSGAFLSKITRIYERYFALYYSYVGTFGVSFAEFLKLSTFALSVDP